MQAGDCKIRLPLATNVGRRKCRIRQRASPGHGGLLRRLKGAVRLAEKDVDTLTSCAGVEIPYGYVRLFVEIEGGNGHFNRGASQYERFCVLEPSIAFAEENADHAWSKSIWIAALKDRQVQLPVLVEIARRQSLRVAHTSIEVHSRLKCSVPIPEQNADISATGIGNCQIGGSVAVQIGDGHGSWSRPNGIAHGYLETNLGVREIAD